MGLMESKVCVITGGGGSVGMEVANRQIRANVICPGPIENEFQAKVEEGLTEVMGTNATEVLNNATPLKRHAKAEEIARMVSSLLPIKAVSQPEAYLWPMEV